MTLLSKNNALMNMSPMFVANCVKLVSKTE